MVFDNDAQEALDSHIRKINSTRGSSEPQVAEVEDIVDDYGPATSDDDENAHSSVEDAAMDSFDNAVAIVATMHGRFVYFEQEYQA